MAGEKALKPLINMERETGFEPATLALARDTIAILMMCD